LLILLLRRCSTDRRSKAAAQGTLSQTDAGSNRGSNLSRGIRPWMLTGGIYGASVVLFTIISTPYLGVALVLGISMIGQLAGGLAVDTLGLLHAKKIPLVPRRLLGILLVTAGVILIALGRL